MVRAPAFQAGDAGLIPVTCSIYARMVELADTPDLGSGGATRAGSSPVTSTNYKNKSRSETVLMELNTCPNCGGHPKLHKKRSQYYYECDSDC